MRKPLALLALAAVFGAAAAADERVKPDLGGGPNLDGSKRQGGEGKPHRGMEVPPPPKPAATPEDANAQQMREEDERRANESKEKMKKKPGYKHEVQAPRV